MIFVIIVLICIILISKKEHFENNIVKKIIIYQILKTKDHKIYEAYPNIYQQNVLKALLDRGFIQHNTGYLSKFFSKKRETMYFTDINKKRLFKVNLYYINSSNQVHFNLL